MIIGRSSGMLLAAITQMPINTLVKSWTSVVHAPSCHQTRVQTSSPEHCKGCLERPGMARTKPEASTTCVEKCMHTLSIFTRSHTIPLSRTLSHPPELVCRHAQARKHARTCTHACKQKQTKTQTHEKRTAAVLHPINPTEAQTDLSPLPAFLIYILNAPKHELSW